MLMKLRNLLLERKLQQLKGTNIAETSKDHFERIAKVGMIFNAAIDTAYKSIHGFARNLEKRGLAVQELGYYPTKDIPDVSSFRFFTPEHLRFDLTPKSEIAEEFINTRFDVLINFAHPSPPPIDYVCAASKALFKVGPASENIEYYDLMIDIPGEFTVGKYLDEVRSTLNLIK